MKKGDYVVLLEDKRDEASFTKNFIYHLRENYTDTVFKVVLDDKGSPSNGYTGHITKVRPATEFEKQLYIKAGHPVEVKLFTYEIY